MVPLTQETENQILNTIKAQSELKQTSEETHKKCERYIIYIVSRLVIIENTKKKKQQIYSGHKYKISAFHVYEKGTFPIYH